VRERRAAAMASVSGAGMHGMPRLAVSSTGRTSGARPPTASGCRPRMPSCGRVTKDLAPLDAVRPTVDADPAHGGGGQAADALEDNLLLAPIQSSVVPLPHQLYALNRAMSRDRIRYLLADEVGLGKTIEAGSDPARTQAARHGQADPRGRTQGAGATVAGRDAAAFRREVQFIEPAELAAFRQWRNDEENLWRMHDQVICSLDSVKPLEGRRGWSLEQLAPTTGNASRI
jgi:hypothetical protein